MERTITLAGDPNIGVFSRVLGNIAIIPPESPDDYKQGLVNALGVDLVETTVQGSAIIGSLVAGNSRGIVMSGLATEAEIACLEKHRKILLLKESMNAAGNVIMANDTFAAVHEDMPPELAREIGEFLEVEVIHLTLGGVKTVGMAGVATNKGVIVHPRATPHQIARLEEVAKIPVGYWHDQHGQRACGYGSFSQRNRLHCRQCDKRV